MENTSLKAEPCHFPFYFVLLICVNAPAVLNSIIFVDFFANNVHGRIAWGEISFSLIFNG